MEWQIIKDQRSRHADLQSSFVRCIGRVGLPPDSGVLFDWSGATYLISGVSDKLGFLELADRIILFNQYSQYITVLGKSGKYSLYCAEWDSFALSNKGRFISYSDSGIFVVGAQHCHYANFLKLNTYFVEIDFSAIVSEVISFQLGSGERRAQAISAIVQEIGLECESYLSTECNSIEKGEHEVYQF